MGLEAVARLDAFVRAGIDVCGAFHGHGGVQGQVGEFGEPLAEAVVKKKVDEIKVGGRGGLVFVHGCCFAGSHLQQPVLGGQHNPGWGGAAGQADSGFVAFYSQRFLLP